MNISLVTSYIIAGILLLAILAMNMNMSISSTELTMTQLIRERAANITDMLTYDIPKIGANRTGKTPAMIVEADSNKIVFNSNIDNSTDNSVETMTWEFTTNPVGSTENPNDYILMRKTEYEDGSVDTTSITSGVTRFLIRYYYKYGSPRSEALATPVPGPVLPEIKQIDVRISLQSAEKFYRNINANGRYVSSVWEKRFSPANLQQDF